METQNVSQDDVFFREYTSTDAIRRYTRETAGFGISHLLEHEYRAVYLDALGRLPSEAQHGPIRVLEFGCGAGMNLVNLVSFLGRHKVEVARAVGTDFSPVLIDAATREARNYLRVEEQEKVEFYVAKNETLIDDLAGALRVEALNVEQFVSFHSRGEYHPLLSSRRKAGGMQSADL